MSRHRKHIIDDPVKPFPLKPGVRYRMVKDSEGRLVVREIGAAGKAKNP